MRKCVSMSASKRYSRQSVDLTRSLSFIDLRARMALRADASKMYLSYVWWVLEPLLFVGIFYFVFGVLLQNGRADYLMFLVVGKLPFQWFTGSVNSAASSIATAKGVISQVNIPKYLFPLAKTHEAAYRQIAVFALLGILLIFDGTQPSWIWLWVAPLIFVQYLVVAFFSMVASMLVCVAQDFSRVIQLFTLAMLFASGIFWDVQDLAPHSRDLILSFNPMAFLIDAYRQVLMSGAVPDLTHLSSLATFFVIANVLLILLMRRLDSWLALRTMGY